MPEGTIFARVHVLILCDDLEERPGEEAVFDLRGVRTHVRARSFRYTHPQLSVYLQMSRHEGAVTGRVVATSEATEEQIAERLLGEFQLLGPLTMIHVQVQLLDCEFPSPAIHWFQVFLNEKLVAERRFLVSEAPGDTNGQPST